MSVLGIVGPVVQLAVQGLKLWNTKEARKYIDEIYEIKQSILEEEQKGYDSDDTKIEYLYKQLAITNEAAANAMLQDKNISSQLSDSVN